MIYVLIAYASSERPGEPAHLHGLARAFADCTRKKGLAKLFIYQLCDLGTFRIFEQRLIRFTVSPEPLPITLKEGV